MRDCRAKRRSDSRDGFTLLEVILALAILGGAVAVLGEIMRMAHRNAEVTRLLTHAQLLAASKMAEITSGIIPVQAVQGVPLDADSDWFYSVEVQPSEDIEGLVVVEVTIAPASSSSLKTVEFHLTRWILDPDLERDDLENPDDAGGENKKSDTGSTRD